MDMKSNSMDVNVKWMLVPAVLLIMALVAAGCSGGSDLAGKMEELESRLSQAEAENGEIKAALEQFRSEFKNIAETSEAVEELLSSSSKGFTDALRSGLRRNEELIKEKENALLQMQEELKNFQEKIAGLDENNKGVIDAMKEEVGDLSESLKQKDDEIKTLSGSLENLRTLLASLKSDLEQAVSQVKPNREMKKLIEDHHIKIVELEESLRKKSDSFNREMTRMEGDIKELRLEFSRLAAAKSRD